MILRRMGTRLQSVTPDFDARAMTEISFRPDGALTLQADEFADEYRLEETRELTATSEGDVKNEVEQAALDDLRAQLAELEKSAGDALCVIESQAGVDYPKTTDRTDNLVVAGENRLFFKYRIEPPLRIGVYRKR